MALYRVLAIFLVSIVLQHCCGQEAYQRKALQLHNDYRTKHHAPALTLDNSLNTVAVKCAQYYAQKKNIDHSCPHKNGVGENLAGGNGTWVSDQFAELSTNMWYDEVKKYNYDNPGFSAATGHFTQVVWKNSLKFGYGHATIGGYTASAGIYSPPGNYQGQFKDNVLRP